MNHTLLAMLSKVCYMDPISWDENLSWILMGYNAIPHATTKFAPYQLLFSQNPNLLSVKVLATMRSPYMVNPLEWWDVLAHKMLIYWQTAKLNIHEMNAMNKKYFDWKVHPYQITEGDKVLWCDMGALSKPTHKLECLWRGPYEVISVNPNQTWVAIDMGVKPLQIKSVGIHHVLKPRDELLQSGQVHLKQKSQLTSHMQVYHDIPPWWGHMSLKEGWYK